MGLVNGACGDVNGGGLSDWPFLKETAGDEQSCVTRIEECLSGNQIF